MGTLLWQGTFLEALMPKADTLSFTLATDDFDVSLLPPDARDRNTPAFCEAVRSYLRGEFSRFGGWNSVQVDARNIEVTGHRIDSPRTRSNKLSANCSGEITAAQL